MDWLVGLGPRLLSLDFDLNIWFRARKVAGTLTGTSTIESKQKLIYTVEPALVTWSNYITTQEFSHSKLFIWDSRTLLGDRGSFLEWQVLMELTTPENTITYHNALCLSPQNFG